MMKVIRYKDDGDLIHQLIYQFINPQHPIVDWEDLIEIVDTMGYFLIEVNDTTGEDGVAILVHKLLLGPLRLHHDELVVFYRTLLKDLDVEWEDDLDLLRSNLS